MIGLNKEQINSISFAFLDKVVELTGKEVVVYSDTYNAINTFSSELAQKYPLWLAEYETETLNTGNWSDWIGLQYTDKGRIPGINDFTDRDNYKQEIFLSSSEAIDTEPITNNNIITYIVRAGNTLSEIALKYDTTINAIAGLNGIQNPNLIFVNQILKIDTTFSRSEQFNTDLQETRHIIYTIKRGDTLTAIANKYGVSIQSIVELNEIVNPNLIFAGERIRINILSGNTD